MAVRIAGVTIPNEKRVVIALTYVFGVGKKISEEVLDSLKIDHSKRVKDLNEKEINDIRNSIEKKHRVEGDLRREIMGNIKRLKEINCYRGDRHTKKLSVRGQRTKTNGRTVRGGGKRVAIAGKKMVAQKT
jgi:small subunit ribosomal protein S13